MFYYSCRYAITEAAYNSLIEESQDQCILISGKWSHKIEKAFTLSVWWGWISSAHTKYELLPNITLRAAGHVRGNFVYRAKSNALNLVILYSMSGSFLLQWNFPS